MTTFLQYVGAATLVAAGLFLLYFFICVLIDKMKYDWFHLQLGVLTDRYKRSWIRLWWNDVENVRAIGFSFPGTCRFLLIVFERRKHWDARYNLTTRARERAEQTARIKADAERLRALQEEKGNV